MTQAAAVQAARELTEAGVVCMAWRLWDGSWCVVAPTPPGVPTPVVERALVLA